MPIKLFSFLEQFMIDFFFDNLNPTRENWINVHECTSAVIRDL